MVTFSVLFLILGVALLVVGVTVKFPEALGAGLSLLALSAITLSIRTVESDYRHRIQERYPRVSEIITTTHDKVQFYNKSDQICVATKHPRDRLAFGECEDLEVKNEGP